MLDSTGKQQQLVVEDIVDKQLVVEDTVDKMVVHYLVLKKEYLSFKNSD
jgi:hypothetical protein